jgi:hypothetical protein
MNAVKMPWDGSHIGDITASVVVQSKTGPDEYICLWEQMEKKPRMIEVKITRHRDDIPLIADEMKRVFDISKIGHCRATYRENEIIVSRYKNEVPLDKYLEGKDRKMLRPGFKLDMQQIFAFRFITCMNCNYENRIVVRSEGGIDFPIGCKETTYSMDTFDKACRMTNTIIKEWFDNDEENFYKACKDLIADKDINTIRFELSKIIRRFSGGRYIGWVNAIFDRLLMIHGMRF